MTADTDPASNLVHVCDAFDALRTKRPYREPWAQGEVLKYLEDGAGTEFDPELARSFITMMRQWEPSVAVVSDERTPVLVPAAAELAGS